MKAIVVGFSTSTSTSPAGVCSPQEAFRVLDYIRDAVDDWRASDGGLTNAACDTRWCCSRAERQIDRLCSIKSRKALAEAISATEEQKWDELNEPYHECYLEEIFDCVIAVGRYLELVLMEREKKREARAAKPLTSRPFAAALAHLA